MRWVVTAAVALSGCLEPRAWDDPARCYDFRADIQPLLDDQCVECHGAAASEGGYRLDGYAALLARDELGDRRVSAGDLDAPLLRRARGLDEHQAADPVAQRRLASWVGDCRLSYFASDTVHPAGFLDPDDATFHGEVLRASSWGFDACVDCHGLGSDPSGGKSGRSCLSCHPAGPTSCDTCHGDPNSPAPPRGLDGSVSRDAPGVGAHRAHLGPTANLGLAVACDACHVVPSTWDADGHVLVGGVVNPPPAEVVLGAAAQRTLAGRVRAGPAVYEPASGTCSNVYCHAAVLGDANAEDPSWTGTPPPLGCDGCHGLPPSSHAAGLGLADCSRCHGSVVGAIGVLSAPERHLDGAVSLGDESETCAACHGSAANPAPPRALAGGDAGSPAVGLHQLHLSGGAIGGPAACADCHTTPTGVSFRDAVRAPGHLDSLLPAEVFPGGAAFAGLGAADEAAPDYDFDAATCSNAYCHGGGAGLLADTSSLVRRDLSWLSDEPMLCGSCHGIPPDDARPEHDGVSLFDCAECHGQSIATNGTFRRDDSGATFHIDGVVDP